MGKISIRRAAGSGSVSYTHLDVYKRQPSREFLFPRGREHARRMFVMSAVQYQRGRLKAFEPSGPMYPGQGSGGCGRGGKGTVSYTHLDVYKRQSGLNGLAGTRGI